MRIVLGILMSLHGVAHIVGFIAAWNLAPASVPYRPITVVGELGHNPMRLIGLLWAFAALAFLAAGMAALRNAQGWQAASMIIVCASLALCILAWPDARIGVYVNVGLAALIVAGRLTGWA